MYSDKYKIRLPFEVLSDLKEMKVVAKPKKPKRKVLQPFTGKGKQKSKVEDILLQVDKISA
jgi:hypothetical protein